jgi:hypothetical protein
MKVRIVEENVDGLSTFFVQYKKYKFGIWKTLKSNCEWQYNYKFYFYEYAYRQAEKIKNMKTLKEVYNRSTKCYYIN